MKFPRNRQIVTYILSASLLLVALLPARVAASALTLAWDPNTEDDLAGYRVYFGTQSGDYGSIIDVGNVTEYTVTGLDPETRYYFALTAYDTSWNESDFSEEVRALTDEEELAVDFGAGGVWEYDGSAWSSLSRSDVQHLCVYDGKLVGDFGSGGLWEFDGTSWAKLTSSDADNSGNCMVAYGASLVFDFGGGGIWDYDGSVWSRLSRSDPEHLCESDGKLVGDFGAGGLWEYDGTSWVKLTSSDADNSGNCMVEF